MDTRGQRQGCDPQRQTKKYTEEKTECKASHERIVKLKKNSGISSVHLWSPLDRQSSLYCLRTSREG